MKIPTLQELEKTLDDAGIVEYTNFLASSPSDDFREATKMSLSRVFVEYGFLPEYRRVNKGDFMTKMKDFDLTRKEAAIGYV